MDRHGLLACLLVPCFLLLMIFSAAAFAGKGPALRSPGAGVLCDSWFCANGKGISVADTRKYLGEKAARKLALQGDFDPGAFTYANGVFCDVKERLCRKDRYFGADGKRNGAIESKYTRLLFGR